jgi:hypothetical protein
MPGHPDIPWVVDRMIVFGVPLLAGWLAWHLGLAAAVALLADGLNAGPLWLSLLLIALTSLPATLLHEVGHALVARRLLGSEVGIRVGGLGRGVVMKVGGVTTTLGALGDPTGAAGVAEFDATYATVDDVVLIALAGPAASLLGFLACVAGLSSVSHGFLRVTVSALALINLIGVLNLLPFRWRDRRNVQLASSDGRMIMDALIVKWALR